MTVEVRELDAGEVERRRRAAGLPVEGDPRPAVERAPGQGTARELAVEVNELSPAELRRRRRAAGLDPEPPEPQGAGVRYAGPADEAPDHEPQPRGRGAERVTRPDLEDGN